MTIRDKLWNIFLFSTCFFTLLAVTNLCSFLPINLKEFNTLPIEAQKDIASHVKFRLSEYRKRLELHKHSFPQRNLMLHLNPQICYNGEKAPEGMGPWPEEMTQYFCATRDIVDWCFRYYRLYQTTEKVFPLSGGYELHVSVACYRVRLYNRILDDYNIPICIITIVMVSCVLHTWYRSYKEKRAAENDNKPNNKKNDIPRPPPPRPPKKKFTPDPAAPLPNLRSRHENYRNRR